MYFRVKQFDKYVGAFMLFSVVVLVAALVFVGRGQRLFEKRYNFTTIFNSASGIEPGSRVILSGIEIGRVKQLHLTTDNRVAITLTILDTYRDRIRADSVARISGPIIGSKVIEISVGPTSREPLYEGGVIGSEETKAIADIIKEIDFKSPMKKLSEILDNIRSITEKLDRESDEITTNLTETTRKINGSVGQITSDVKEMTKGMSLSLERITDNLEKGTSEIRGATRSLTKTLGTIETITTEINDGKGNVGAAIKERGLYDNLLEASASVKKTTVSFEKASSDLSELTDEISDIISNIKKSTSNIDQMLNTGQESMEEAQRVIESVKKIWPISRNIREPEPVGSISIDGREQPRK